MKGRATRVAMLAASAMSAIEEVSRRPSAAVSDDRILEIARESLQGTPFTPRLTMGGPKDPLEVQQLRGLILEVEGREYPIGLGSAPRLTEAWIRDVCSFGVLMATNREQLRQVGR